MEKIIIAFDTETTGLIKPEVADINKQPQIIEYYGLKAIKRSDGVIEKIDEFETYLLPNEEVSATITKITGITQAMVSNAPKFVSVFKQLADFHRGVDTWTAHNLAFDAAMIANELSRIGKVLNFPFPTEHICTVQKSMHIEQRRMTLTNLHKELFGHEFTGAHRAKTDVEAQFRCFQELHKQGVIKW